jgi:hypothetical protein
MKTKMTYLFVFFIGKKESTLTNEEEKAISDYIRSHKEKIKQKSTKRKVDV